MIKNPILKYFYFLDLRMFVLSLKNLLRTVGLRYHELVKKYFNSYAFFWG